MLETLERELGNLYLKYESYKDAKNYLKQINSCLNNVHDNAHRDILEKGR